MKFSDWHPLGIPGEPYAYRCGLFFRDFSLRVHRWLGNDDPDAFHTHPQGFYVLVLRGGYDDVTLRGVEKMRPGSFRYRAASHSHTVQNVLPGTLTVCVFFGPKRRWDFQSRATGKKMKRDKYFAEVGHHSKSGKRVRTRPDGSIIT